MEAAHLLPSSSDQRHDVGIHSVKAAVSMFGGIVDWKSHRVQSNNSIQQQLHLMRQEIQAQKKQCEAVEDAKTTALKQLATTNLLIQQLKSNLVAAETQEQQAKRDFQLAKLRLEGIQDEECFTAPDQLHVARDRHATASSQLQNIKDQLHNLNKDYVSLLAQKDAATKTAEDTVSKLKAVEKAVGDLTIELFTLKQSLRTALTVQMVAEEHRVGEAILKDEENLNWEKQLEKAEQELQKLKQQLLSTKGLKSKLDEATTLLRDQRDKFAAYMDSGLTTKQLGLEDLVTSIEKRSRGDIEVSMAAAANELDQLNQNITKTEREVQNLELEASSWESDLEEASRQLAAIKQREAKASVAIPSIESEMYMTKIITALIHMNEKKNTGDLPKRLKEASHEVDQAKGRVRKSLNNLQKAEEEAEEAKAGARTMKSRLTTLQKEIETARAHEMFAQVAIALEGRKLDDSKPQVSLSVEEYYELRKRVHEAEEQANMKLGVALSQIEAAKASESRKQSDLEQATKELSKLKSALEVALNKAEKAEEEKLDVEQELTMRIKGYTLSSLESIKCRSTLRNDDQMESYAVMAKKKKKSYFSRFFMFLVRR